MRVLIVLLLSLHSLIVMADVPKHIDIKYQDIRQFMDGKIFYINCIKGLRCYKGLLGIRIENIDVPDVNGRCGYEKRLAQLSRGYARQILKSANRIVLFTSGHKTYDRYDRLYVRVEYDGKPFNDEMIRAGVAQEARRERHNWCNPGKGRGPLRPN